jgi:Mn-dependent DtxR family transcriptional regulator
MSTTTLRPVLLALFDLARGDRPATADRVARAAGVSPDAARAALRTLERAGLADAMRVRLTFAGLAVAAAAAAGRELPAALAA